MRRPTTSGFRRPHFGLGFWVVRILTGTGERFFKPTIQLPDKEQRLLSFVNLVEAHVLDAIRRAHGVALWRVRKAIDYLKKQLGSPHPLAEQRFVTDKVDLFVEMFGNLVNISQEGQLAMKELIETHLRRIERDTAGLPIRLYPSPESVSPTNLGLSLSIPTFPLGGRYWQVLALRPRSSPSATRRASR